jgi:CheY-like chemotaxis protein
MSKRILMVDDEIIAMASMVDHLTDEGFMILGVENIPEALQALREKNFDAILVDCMMPTGSKDITAKEAGVQLVKEIRSGAPGVAEENKRIPIVILTAICDQEILTRLEGTDVQAIIQKPVLTSDLIDVLQSLLEKDRDTQLDKDSEGAA